MVNKNHPLNLQKTQMLQQNLMKHQQMILVLTNNFIQEAVSILEAVFFRMVDANCVKIDASCVEMVPECAEIVSSCAEKMFNCVKTNEKCANT
ncbi:hypothetical protein GCM10007199_02560 [Fictibacillus barbaricus]|nr:hypothetical protein GCM10007199_02560 [Fictibacillus barbaricus]